MLGLEDTIIGDNVRDIQEMVISQRNKVSKLVAEVCTVDEKTGKIVAKPGVSREQLLFLIKTINKINDSYNYSIEQIESLNKEIEEFDKEVNNTRNKILDFEKSGYKFPKLIRDMYGI